MEVEQAPTSGTISDRLKAFEGAPGLPSIFADPTGYTSVPATTTTGYASRNFGATPRSSFKSAEVANSTDTHEVDPTMTTDGEVAALPTTAEEGADLPTIATEAVAPTAMGESVPEVQFSNGFTPAATVKRFEPPAEKQKFRRTYQIENTNFKPAVFEEAAERHLETVNVTIPSLKRRPKRLVTSSNGLSASANGMTCRVSYQSPKRKIMSTVIRDHSDDITDLQWSPMRRKTGLSMLGTVGKDGKLLLHFIVMEKDEQGDVVGLKVLAMQEFTCPGYEPGSEEYYSHIRITGNPYNGSIAVAKQGAVGVRIVKYKLMPKFAEFDGGLPPEPENWNELPPEVENDDETDHYETAVNAPVPVAIDGLDLDAREGVPVDGVPVDGEPVECAPVDGVPVDGVPVDGVPVDGLPVDGLPVDGVLVDGVPVDDVPVDDVPVDAMPVDAMPVDGVPREGLDALTAYDEEPVAPALDRGDEETGLGAAGATAAAVGAVAGAGAVAVAGMAMDETIDDGDVDAEAVPEEVTSGDQPDSFEQEAEDGHIPPTEEVDEYTAEVMAVPEVDSRGAAYGQDMGVEEYEPEVGTEEAPVEYEAPVTYAEEATADEYVADAEEGIDAFAVGEEAGVTLGEESGDAGNYPEADETYVQEGEEADEDEESYVEEQEESYVEEEELVYVDEGQIAAADADVATADDVYETGEYAGPEEGDQYEAEAAVAEDVDEDYSGAAATTAAAVGATAAVGAATYAAVGGEGVADDEIVEEVNEVEEDMELESQDDEVAITESFETTIETEEAADYNADVVESTSVSITRMEESLDADGEVVVDTIEESYEEVEADERLQSDGSKIYVVAPEYQDRLEDYDGVVDPQSLTNAFGSVKDRFESGRIFAESAAAVEAEYRSTTDIVGPLRSQTADLSSGGGISKISSRFEPGAAVEAIQEMN